METCLRIAGIGTLVSNKNGHFDHFAAMTNKPYNFCAFHMKLFPSRNYPFGLLVVNRR